MSKRMQMWPKRTKNGVGRKHLPQQRALSAPASVSNRKPRKRSELSLRNHRVVGDITFNFARDRLAHTRCKPVITFACIARYLFGPYNV